MLPLRSGILAQAINMKIFTKNHSDSPHSYPDSTHSHPYSPHSHSDSLHSPHFQHFHPHSTHSHPDSTHPDSSSSHPVPTQIPRVPIIPLFRSPIPHSGFYRQLFSFDINSEGIVFSKLVSQLKLLPILSELEDKDTIVMGTIRKDCKVFSLSQANRCQKWRYLFCFEARKNIPQVNYGKPHREKTDCTF